MIKDDENAPTGQTDGTNGAPVPPLNQTGECIGAELIASCLGAVKVDDGGVTIGGDLLASMLGMDRATMEKMLQDALSRGSKAATDEETPGPTVDQLAQRERPEPPAEDPFDQTMRSLVFPDNLADYYVEVYVGFKQCISAIISPENTPMIQRALGKVSGLMEEGLVDWRGPVGLLIHILRQWSAVPNRVIPSESRG